MSAPWTTWLLVRIRPSGVKMNPEPLPPIGPCGWPRPPRGSGRLLGLCRTSMLTTAGLARRAALTTARE